MTGLQRFLASMQTLPATEPDEPRLVGDAARRAHEAAQESQLGIHLARCGVPRDIRDRIAAGLDAQHFSATAAVRGWAQRQDAVFLLLGGGVGSGKSTAAAEVLKLARGPFYGYDSDGGVFGSWRYEARRGAYISAVDLSDRAIWTDDGARLWERARTVPWLVLDDVGTETQNERGPFLADFQNLIGQRHANNLRTVLTTNLDGKTFRTRYGARVLDRLLEKGVAFDAGAQSKRRRLA
jgi:DNA replication protein DnaC